MLQVRSDGAGDRSVLKQTLLVPLFYCSKSNQCIYDSLFSSVSRGSYSRLSPEWTEREFEHQ